MKRLPFVLLFAAAVLLALLLVTLLFPTRRQEIPISRGADRAVVVVRHWPRAPYGQIVQPVDREVAS